MVFINAHYFRTREIEFEITRTNKYTNIQIYTHTHSALDKEKAYICVYIIELELKSIPIISTYYIYLQL